MSVLIKHHSSAKPVSGTRSTLGLAGGGFRVSEEPNSRKEGLKQQPRRLASEVPRSVVRNNASVDSSCSSGSCSSGSSVKTASSKGRVRRNGLKSMKSFRGVAQISPQPGHPKRCDWITPSSDPLYISFHDEEWGVPVRDDKKLFELLVLSQALAELSWRTILHKRDVFRKLFDNFDLSSVASFTEKKLVSLIASGSLLSEPKLRAVVENAEQIFKVQQEFGSFSNYCWSFMNHKPVQNGFRYARQIPAKTPKAEFISKDLMRRGFRCVGPTVIYSFMQVAGMVNDHLQTCFRFHDCNTKIESEAEPKIEEIQVPIEALENSFPSPD